MPKKFRVVRPPGPACHLNPRVLARGDDSVTDRAKFRTDQFGLALIGNVKPPPFGTDSIVPSPTGLAVSPTRSDVSTPVKRSVRLLMPFNNVIELVPDPTQPYQIEGGACEDSSCGERRVDDQTSVRQNPERVGCDIDAYQNEKRESEHRRWQTLHLHFLQQARGVRSG